MNVIWRIEWLHESELINSCPDCRETIPFLLTNQQLDDAFMCKCGHLPANLHSSSWKEWSGQTV